MCVFRAHLSAGKYGFTPKQGRASKGGHFRYMESNQLGRKKENPPKSPLWFQLAVTKICAPNASMSH